MYRTDVLSHSKAGIRTGDVRGAAEDGAQAVVTDFEQALSVLQETSSSVDDRFVKLVMKAATDAYIEDVMQAAARDAG